MFAIKEDFKSFLLAERGAVTVDYVVLTAAATGLAIAASTELSNGFSYLTNVVASELSEQGDAYDPRTIQIYDDAFANNSSDWHGATVSELFGLGTVLGPIEGANGGAEQVTRSFDVPENLDSVTLQFDLYALDDLDPEDSGFIYIGNEKVGSVSQVGGQTVFTPIGEHAGVTVTAVVLENQVQLGGAQVTGDDSLDSRVSFSITVDNPELTVDFGFGSNATGDRDNESFALDNFSVTGLAPEPEDVQVATNESGDQDDDDDYDDD
ncbi:MAG: hypothetical protein AAGF30_09550 [Pseudomonadota bacterium]